MNKRAFGDQGEKEASEYLIKKGCTILCRNFRIGRMGEIDIILRDGGTLCFVEVKTRTSTLYGTPSEAVSFKKQATIRRIAQLYMQRFYIADEPIRFDIVEVFMDRDGRLLDVSHILNAF